MFAIADEQHELNQGLKKSEEVREHLKQQGYQTTRKYVEYHGWLTRRTHMKSKAIDMFNQTVAVKDIQSLNEFIRNHMLEARNWNEKVQTLLTHFNDLSVAYNELVRAQRAEILLAPVEKVGQQYRTKKEELNRYEQQIEAAKSFFPSMKIKIFEPEIETQKRNMATMETAIQRLDRQLKQSRETVRQLKNEIEQAGGERLKQIPGLINHERTHLAYKRETFQQYQENLKTCGINEIIGSPHQFKEVRDQLSDISEATNNKSEDLKNRQEDTIGKKVSVENLLKSEKDELATLQQRRSNLPTRFIAIRSQLCAELNLDEIELPFAAELISVLPEEQDWSASIEMVLRSFALSLLVPERYYPRVRAYAEHHRITNAQGEGQRLDYLCVGTTAKSDGDRIHAQSLYHKLQFKPRHELSPWLREEIRKRFDFCCCNSVEEFNEISRNAITTHRHVKFNSKRHQKDDRSRTTDPRHFVLGWNNEEKKRHVLRNIQQLETELSTFVKSLSLLEGELEQVYQKNRSATAALTVTDFDAIDAKRHQDEIVELEKEKKCLEESNDAVKALQSRLLQAETQEQSLSQERDGQLQQKAKLENDLERVSALVGSAYADLKAQQKIGKFAEHQRMFDIISAAMGEPALSITDFDVRMRAWKSETADMVIKVREPLDKLGEKLVELMSKYLREFKEETDDLDAAVKSLDSFQGKLDQLRHEDLPRYEKKFKNRLNDQVSSEIALFNTGLRQEQSQIEEKISQLNKALADVDYSPGTFMRLKPKFVQDREIEEFRRSLRECLDGSLEHTQEANEARFLRIKTLVERLSDKERTTWRNKVIDVRRWYDFSAEEIERDSKTKRSCYDGSSGQSGGEKAKLAFTILVAALAYQFDIDPNGNTPGRFQFVVVDEMFSKVDDQNAEYALKLFKQFGLQLLIVAPLDAKARITEPFVDRYLHVVKDSMTNCSQLFSMTAREYDEVVNHTNKNGHTNGVKQTGVRQKRNQQEVIR